MNHEAEKLLTEIPEGVAYTDDPADLDPEDITDSRIKAVIQLLSDGNEYYRLRAAILLANWGESVGVTYLCNFVENSDGQEFNWFPHRLRPYDETYKVIFEALEGFWAFHTDQSSKDQAKQAIVPTLRKIIKLAGHLRFELRLGFLMLHGRFDDLLPDVKRYFEEILRNPDFHHWKIEDTASVLSQIDPQYVAQKISQTK